MKSNITLSIDTKIVEQLKRETNYSDLVNEQIKAYYAVSDVQNKELLSKKLMEIKQILKENRRKKREIEAQIAKIQTKERKIKEAFKQKNITRAKLIRQIAERREIEKKHPYIKKQYVLSIAEEADRILKGGDVNA